MNLLAVQKMQEIQVQSLGREDPLEEEMAAHSSILPWRIPIDRGAWQATVHGVTKGQTRLKRLSTCTPQILKAHTHSLFITFFSLILCPENSTNLISPKFWLSLFSSSSPQCSNLYQKLATAWLQAGLIEDLPCFFPGTQRSLSFVCLCPRSWKLLLYIFWPCFGCFQWKNKYDPCQS